jgi:hypothetical protein
VIDLTLARLLAVRGEFDFQESLSVWEMVVCGCWLEVDECWGAGEVMTGWIVSGAACLIWYT